MERAGPRYSGPGGSSPPWRRAPGSCRRRSGPRGSSPAARRSSAGRAPGRHSPAACQLQRVVGIGHVGVLQADHLGLTRPVAVDRPARPHRAASRRVVGNEQIRRDRHGVLGVEHDLVPAVPVALDGLEGLDVERNRRGLGAEQLVKAAAATLDPRGDCRRVRLGERVFVRRGGQTNHPLIPGRIVPDRRGQDEAPGVRRALCVIGHGGPFARSAPGRAVQHRPPARGRCCVECRRGEPVAAGGRPRFGSGAAFLGIRPASVSARRSNSSICALTLRISSLAHRARASCTAGSTLSRTCRRSLTYRANQR